MRCCYSVWLIAASALLPYAIANVSCAAPATSSSIAATEKVAKIYGAGGLGGIDAYQSAIVVSADGLLMTVSSAVLDEETVTVVLHDGKRYSGQVVGSDPVLGAALIRIDPAGEPLAAFELDESTEIDVGDPLFVLANVFGIATGNESVSLMRGVYSSRSPLRGWRGADRRVDGDDVIIVDTVTSNPGAAGGAVVDARGRLVGMVGPEMRSRVTGAWLNFAIPAEQLRSVSQRLLAGDRSIRSGPRSESPPRFDLLRVYGFELTPAITARTPAYVDYVRRGSAAERIGLQPDDLVISVDGLITGSVRELRRVVDRRGGGSPLKLLIQRSGEFIEVELLSPEGGE